MALSGPPLKEAWEILDSLRRAEFPQRPKTREDESHEWRVFKSAWRQWQQNKRYRLGAPFRIDQAQWRAFGKGEELPDKIAVELEARRLILAIELQVDVISSDWREVTAERATVRLLTGNGASRRRFPGWLLSDQHTNDQRPFPDNGPLRVVRPSHRKRRFTDEQLDEAGTIIAAARKAGTNVNKALLPLASRIGGPKQASALARSLGDAMRNRSRRRAR